MIETLVIASRWDNFVDYFSSQKASINRIESIAIVGDNRFHWYRKELGVDNLLGIEFKGILILDPDAWYSLTNNMVSAIMSRLRY